MNNLKKILNYAKEKRGYYLLSLFLSAISTIASFVPYYYFYLLLRLVMQSNYERSELNHIVLMILLWTLIYTLSYLCSLFCSHLFAFRIETNIKKEGLKKLLHSSFAFFDLNSSGKVRKIIDDNTGQTHTIVAHIIPDMVNAMLFPICMIALGFWLNLYLGLLFIFEIVVSIICFKFMYSGDSKSSMEEYLSALEKMSAEVVEYLRGIQVVKVFNAKLEAFNRLHNSINNYAVMINKMSQKSRVPFSFFETSLAAFGSLCIFIAYRMIGNNAISHIITFVIMVVLTSSFMLKAFMKVMFFNQQISIASNAISKIEDVYEQMQTNKVENGSIDKMDSFDIEFKNVSFAYKDKDFVLENVNIKFEEGKKYALTGPSGGGKSTLAKLISGFYPINDGEILIGGKSINEYTQECLEKNISFIFQNSKLFKTSIFENVKIGNENASDQEVRNALKLARCEDILAKFKDGENTIIGSKGVHLSGGEVQRIATARAILKDAPIIILDEASAASDPENEYEMQKAFSELMKNKTVIMIAHRLSSFRNIDEIVVIDNNNVLEKGSHAELMSKDTLYKQLYNSYNKANEWRVKC